MQSSDNDTMMKLQKLYHQEHANDDNNMQGEGKWGKYHLVVFILKV